VIFADFPGRIFLVKTTVKPDRKALHATLAGGRANLTVRNFPASVAEIRKKRKLDAGGEGCGIAANLEEG